MHLPNPVIRSHYRNGFIKQYVRDHLILRTEAATNNVTDYGMNKAVEHLPALRDKLSAIDDSYLDIQQDILETFIDRGHLQRLARPTVTPSGKRIPGLKLESPRQLALMHALVRFAQIPAANTSAPAKSIRTSSPPWGAASNGTLSPPCATTSLSSAPKVWSRSCPAPAAIACQPRVTRSA